MAVFAVLGTVVIIMGACVGAYFKLCSAIRREDRIRGSLRLDAPNHSAQSARDLVGISSSRWD
jgi:hypothetical protein